MRLVSEAGVGLGLCMVAHAYNLTAQEVGQGEVPPIRGQPEFHGKFQIGLMYKVRPCVKK